MALGPRSGSARNVCPPAQAIPDPSPPSMLAGLPFSSVSVSPERSVKEPASVRVNSPTAINTGWGDVWAFTKQPEKRNRATRAPERKTFLIEGLLFDFWI